MEGNEETLAHIEFNVQSSASLLINGYSTRKIENCKELKSIKIQTNVLDDYSINMQEFPKLEKFEMIWDNEPTEGMDALILPREI